MSTTLSQIERRLSNGFGFQLRPHMKTIIKVHGSLLDGVDFVAVDHTKLAGALRVARDKRGRRAFAGQWIDGKLHLPLKLSFGKTSGEGFREIFYVGDPKPGRPAIHGSANFSSMFAERPQSSHKSLHFAVSPGKCNVHVDQRDFVIGTPDGGVALTADFADHLVNELVWKTLTRDALTFLPPGFFDRTSIVLPNSANRYAKRLGFEADLKRAKSYSVTFKATCSLTNARNWSGTLNLRGVFGGS